MAFRKNLAPLSITPEEEDYLEQVANSRTEGFDRVRRARVLLAYSQGQPTTQIRDAVGISFGALSKCIKKALAAGIEEALADLPRSGRPAEITPEAWTIRLLLDNHSSHISKETRAWLAKQPNRFVLVFTPTHGSWLNLVETLFSKMTRSFLRGLRV